jgi:hypothetical protein
MKINDIKGSYKNDLVYKYAIFHPEPNKSRSMCVVTDNIFEYICSPKELFHPEHPPLHAYSLPIKSQWHKISVFRRAQLDTALQTWGTHPTKAIPYPRDYGSLQHFSLVQGFHHKSLIFTCDSIQLNCMSLDPITPYCIHRSINSISAALSVKDRDKIMTHKGQPGQMFIHCFPIVLTYPLIATRSIDMLRLPLPQTCRVYNVAVLKIGHPCR